jgi:hypothetical protein
MKPSDLGLSPLALRLLDPASPTPLRLLAARGVAPALPVADALFVAIALRDDADETVRNAAKAYVAAPPPAALDAAIDGAKSAFAVCALAESLALEPDRAARLFRNPLGDDAARAAIVRRASANALEQLASIDAILGGSPEALRALAAHGEASAAVRATCAEIAAAAGITLEATTDAHRESSGATPTGEAASDAEVDSAIDSIHAKLASASSGAPSDSDAGSEVEAETKRVLPLAKFLETLSVSQKIRRATIGSGEERAILVRDTNRLVAEAAITSPRIQENEVLRIAANRSVSSDVLRRIAESREWMKSYPIKVVLVQNPRVPMPLALRLLPMLREADLKRVAASRSVPSAVAAAAKREMQKKQ